MALASQIAGAKAPLPSFTRILLKRLKDLPTNYLCYNRPKKVKPCVILKNI
jgi:hypothetical protein